MEKTTDIRLYKNEYRDGWKRGEDISRINEAERMKIQYYNFKKVCKKDFVFSDKWQKYDTVQND